MIQAKFIAIAVFSTVITFVLFILLTPANSAGIGFEKCVRAEPRAACVVDGDTIWFEAVKYRLRDVDTPEPERHNGCGGDDEIKLANRATERLLFLLNNNNWSIESFGDDGLNRTLATIQLQGGLFDGRFVADVLIEEKLGRDQHRPDNEFWCPGVE